MLTTAEYKEALSHAIRERRGWLNWLLQEAGCPESVDSQDLLIAIARVESNFGAFAHATRFEIGIKRLIERATESPKDAGGLLLNLEYMAKQDRLCCSFGPFQVLGLVHFELGFKADPEAMFEPNYATAVAVEYLRQRAIPSATKAIKAGKYPDDQTGWISAIADAYNSGSATDRHKPEEYIRRILDNF